MICPRCGSNNVTTQYVPNSYTTQSVKGFGWIKACLGYFIFGPIGVLCGLCGMGKGRRTTYGSKVTHVCQNCGNHF